MGRSGAIDLFAHDQQDPQAAGTLFQKALDRLDHGRGDAVGVAGPAAPDEFVVLTRWDERRHGVHVCREHNLRLAPPCPDVVAAGLDFLSFDRAAEAAGQRL